MSESTDKHLHGCLCAICRWRAEGLTQEEAIAKFAAWEAEQFEQYGWLAHYVCDERLITGANYHTHGLADNFNHRDLQIAIPLSQKTAHGIFIGVVDLVKEGKTFKTGDTAEKVVKGYKVKFVDALDGDRPVLRIIIPDAEGNLEKGTIGGGLDRQYDDL